MSHFLHNLTGLKVSLWAKMSEVSVHVRHQACSESHAIHYSDLQT